jgi:hypothetical protein
MIRSKFIVAPVTLALIIVVACLASSSAAQSCGGCTQSSCPYSQEWSAKSFLDNTPTETNTGATKENADKASDKPNSSIKAPTSSIELKNTSAEPNPVNLGRPVKIAAVFGNNFTATNGTKITAYATIRNSAGTEVDKVNMEHTSGEEYAGIWNANVAVGVYEATIVASASNASKNFNDALRIEVISSSDVRTVKKLG